MCSLEPMNAREIVEKQVQGRVWSLTGGGGGGGYPRPELFGLVKNIFTKVAFLAFSASSRRKK